MFTQKIEYIFTLSKLKQAYSEISKNSSGLDEISYQEFEKELTHNLKDLNSYFDNEFSDKSYS